MTNYITTNDYKTRDLKTNKIVNQHPVDQIPAIGITRAVETEKDVKYSPEKYLLTKVPHRPWEGQRCFIIGGGPSLKGFDFSKLNGELVIATNRSVEFYEKAAFNFFLDEQFFSWATGGKLGEKVKSIFDNFQGYKTTISRVGFPYPEDIYMIDYKSAGQGILSSNLQEGVYCGSNSGFASLMLAVALGAKEIYLLGFDMIPGTPDKKQTWFHDGYPEAQDATICSLYAPDFIQAAPVLKDRGIRVVNLNPDSALKCFEFGRFEDIKPINRPVVVSFYTPEYKALAERMIRSAQLFGFDHDVIAIEKKGSWLDTIYGRAEFILKMLLKHGKDVLWLDCDAVIQKYPDLLNNFDHDFAAHVHEWEDRPAELLGGTMYFKHSQECINFVEKWIALNKKMPKQPLSQMVIPEALKASPKLNVGKLPGSYCQIFDLMAKQGEPVIEHFQASRQFREIV